jgi:hypothetical protein
MEMANDYLEDKKPSYLSITGPEEDSPNKM